MEKISCPHGCKVLLKKKPNGALECPKCKCTFRITLCVWTPKCFKKHNPEYGQGKELKKVKHHAKRRKRRGS